MGLVGGKLGGAVEGACHKKDDSEQPNDILELCCLGRDHSLRKSIDPVSKYGHLHCQQRAIIIANTTSEVPDQKGGAGSKCETSDCSSQMIQSQIFCPASNKSQSQHFRFSFSDLPQWTSAQQQQLEQAVLVVASSRNVKPPGLKAMKMFREAQINGRIMSINDSRFGAPSNDIPSKDLDMQLHGYDPEIDGPDAFKRACLHVQMMPSPCHSFWKRVAADLPGRRTADECCEM